MKLSIALMASAVLLSGPVLAQTAAKATQQAPPPQHQPGTPAHPAPPGQDASPAPAVEKPDPAKDAAIRRLMEITQTNKMGDNIVAAIGNQVQQVMSRAIQPERLPKFMDDFHEKFTASAPSGAVADAVIPIYARHFSTDDIQGLIQFYESPLGQRVVKTMPQVTQESESAGIQLDQKAAIKVLRGMQDEYPELKQMLPPENGAPGAGPEPPPAPGPALAPKPSAAPPQK
ncbi:MAG TPA: DUF2059 domain-containing protein [Verrucomicrobiae bacterium]|jgi:hypothetical protein|nr:DUF2059 domain-containing protein [Verrucomicrobiae bacterium]